MGPESRIWLGRQNGLTEANSSGQWQRRDRHNFTSQKPHRDRNAEFVRWFETWTRQDLRKPQGFDGRTRALFIKLNAPKTSGQKSRPSEAPMNVAGLAVLRWGFEKDTLIRKDHPVTHPQNLVGQVIYEKSELKQKNIDILLGLMRESAFETWYWLL